MTPNARSFRAFSFPQKDHNMPFDALPVLDEVDLTLRVARGYVERGWCKATIHRRNEEYCAVGAIRMAVAGDMRVKSSLEPLYQKTARRLLETLPTMYRSRHRESDASIMVWNDRNC